VQVDIRVYASSVVATAKVFKSGNNQLVRLPRQFRFGNDIDELEIKREGDRLVLSPARRSAFTSAFWRALGAWPSFERPKQTRQRRRRIFP